MRVAHLVQQHQRLLELPWSTSSQKEGGPIGQPRRENPSRVTGTSGGSGERDATQPLRDKEEGLASVEVEANSGTEGPSLSTMWSAAERAYQETKRIGLYAVASAHNNSQSAVYKSQAGLYHTTRLD